MIYKIPTSLGPEEVRFKMKSSKRKEICTDIDVSLLPKVFYFEKDERPFHNSYSSKMVSQSSGFR